jgi:beta-lactamase superfamily II metal-dependent hydrolase
VIHLTKKRNSGRKRSGRKRKNGFSFRKHSHLIWLIVLLCLFFATGTNEWLLNTIDLVADYTGIECQLDFNLTKESVSQAEGEMTVHILDVGQGSACLVESEGHYMLFDGGPGDYSSYVVAYLRDQGVKQLDYVIASHYDADHISGLVGVLNVYPVETMLCPDYETDTKIYASLMSKQEANGCAVVHPETGDTYTLGDANFTVVAPVKDDYEEVNNRSIGIRLVHGGNSFLMLGDAEKESEADLCASGQTICSDVYLVSHHGSSSSTTAELLAKVQPSVAVISVGVDNAYGHPTEQTMQRLKKAGVALYRTDRQGTITVTSDGETLQWDQDACMDFSSGSK